jgi:hypothetical protein
LMDKAIGRTVFFGDISPPGGHRHAAMDGRSGDDEWVWLRDV